MQIRSRFSYKAIERAYEIPEVTMIMQEVFKIIQEPINDKEHNFSIDSSGMISSVVFTENPEANESPYLEPCYGNCGKL